MLYHSKIQILVSNILFKKEVKDLLFIYFRDLRVSSHNTDSITEKLGDPTSYVTCNLNLTHAGSLDV